MIVELQHDPAAVKTYIKQMRAEGGENHPVISGSDINLYLFYGARIVFKLLDDRPVSVNMTKIGKRKKNAWEPYANWYGAFTLPEFRRRGLATELYRDTESAALAAGCRRIKSLAGSSAGLGLHLSLDHECWGLTANNEVWVDSALPGHADKYDHMSKPPQVPGDRMIYSEIEDLIQKGLRYDNKA